MPSKAALAAMAANKKIGPEPLPKASRVELLRKASKRVEEEEAQCAVFDKKVSDLVPRFEEEEVKSGKKLGEGGFCSVFEVTALNLGSEGADAYEEKHKSEIEEFHTRKYMSMTCIRKDEARYAVKRLSEKSLGDKTLYEKGTADLAFEANFLAVIQHSNIIKVRGFRLGDFCSDGMFIMMDRLYDTLDQAIGKWREQEKKYTSLTGKLKGGKDKSLDLLADRMHFACDLASAFGHLHDMKIIYRDLKPENVGFDIRGDIKIFDFGLAKEVRDPDDEGNYKLTGYCGSPMYMAPEVLKCVPYNLAADVYSFAIVFWQMVALTTPYKKVPKSVLEKMVMEKGYRPEISDKWQPTIKSLIKKCWDQDPRKRPGFTSIKKLVYDCVVEAGGDDELNSSLDKSSRSFRNMKLANT